MNTKLFVIALCAYLGVSQCANAGVMLAVSFQDDPNIVAPDIVTDLQQLQPVYNKSGQSLTANIYLHLTPRTDWAAPALTSIYGYGFSVLHDSSLELVTREEFRPPGFDLRETITKLVDGNLLLGFNASMSVDNFMREEYYKVATLTFRIKSTLTSNTLISAGKYYSDPDVFTDGISTEDFVAPNLPNDRVVYNYEQFGGTFGGSAVPEPASVVVLGMLGLLVFARKRQRRLDK